jgi:hypothetical protein
LAERALGGEGRKKPNAKTHDTCCCYPIFTVYYASSERVSWNFIGRKFGLKGCGEVNMDELLKK